MRIRHLIAFLLVVGLGATGAMASTWTVYPTAVTLDTGWTDYATKNAGEALIYGGASVGTIRAQSGWFKFDTTAVPDATAATQITFHFYVNLTYWPYFKLTPVSNDPVLIASNAQVLWDDIQAEVGAGFYNDLQETSAYAPGWKSVVMGGTSVADLMAGLPADWFAFGATEYFGSPSYYVEIDGVGDPNLPYLVVTDDVLSTCDDVLVDLGHLVCPATLSATGDTTGAMNYCGNASGDAHYSFTVDVDGDYVISLCDGGTTYDSYLRLYDDACCGNQIAYNDDSCGLQSEMTVYLTTTGAYYVHVEGYSTDEGPYSLVIGCPLVPVVPPSALTCTENGADVDLAWTNGEVYDSITVFEDDVLIATLPGTDTTYTVVAVAKGGHCWYVCGTVDTQTECSDNCCLIIGYDDVDLLWDFEADDGGFVTDGTTGWQWGAPIYGPCEATADGNVWGTNLDGDYVNNACWLLDSPAIDFSVSDKGGYICFDHCYDIEDPYDGGVVWFTTDDYWYYNFEPLEGTDGVITANAGCSWVAGRNGFTGDSGGWVTDCWEFTDAMWSSEQVKIRFAFGSDASVATYSGWLIDNVTVYRNLEPGGTIDCAYTITPLVGTVSFWTNHNVQLINLATSTRQIAGRIVVLVASGTTYNPWKFGFTNVAAGSSYVTAWNTNIPALGTVIGNNIFTLFAEDITPAPYNQPPFAPSGDQCTKVNVVVANAP